MRVQRGMVTLTPGKIASHYAAFGLLWISTSDIVVLQLWSSEQTISAIQTVKGGAFVALSGALIWGLTDHRERQLRDSRNRLESVTQRLQVLQRVFRHNIRNGLNVVQGNIDLHREKAPPNTDFSHLDTASETVGDILDISEKLKVVDQYTVGEAIGTIDIVDVITEEVAAFEATYPAVAVETDLPEEAVVKGDGSLTHVISEVLDNTAEHFDAAIEELRVRVAVTMSSDEVEVLIADNGPGIYEDEIHALRTGRESSLDHLSSVGLWLVYWLCERVDGEIEIDSQSRTGTGICLRFKRPVAVSAVSWSGATSPQGGETDA